LYNVLGKVKVAFLHGYNFVENVKLKYQHCSLLNEKTEQLVHCTWDTILELTETLNDTVIILKSALLIIVNNPTLKYTGDDCICEANIVPLYECYLACLDDYTIDRRGDIGAWVREAAMTGLAQLTLTATQADLSLVPEVCIKQVMPR
jgi:hypothetical protein